MAYQKLQPSQAKTIDLSADRLVSTTIISPNYGTPTPPATFTTPGINSSGSCILYVGVAGNVRVITAAGDDVTFVGVLAGTYIPVQVVQVVLTNFAAPTDTTATDIIALW